MRRKVTYDPDRDYYVVLGIDGDATTEDIRHAYRRSVREYHPDLNPHRAAWATDQIQLVNEAYDVLRDPARRRDYDRQRWPYLPAQPAPDTARRRSRSHDLGYEAAYNSDLPWWEQVVATVPREWKARRYRRAAQQAAARARPFWLDMSDWLRAHHLGALDHSWLALVGLWRCPYGGLISFLGGLLAINVALIIYAFIAPENSFLRVGDWFESGPANISGGEKPTITPDYVQLFCPDPGAQIHLPVEYDGVADTFSVYGTVDHPDLWHYTLHVGYVGPVLTTNPVVENWRLVRGPPINQTLAEAPIVGTVLTDELVNLTGQPSGYYVIRLWVVLRDRRVLPPCDVIVRH